MVAPGLAARAASVTLVAVPPVRRLSVIPLAWCPPLDSSRAGAVEDWLESGEGGAVAALAAMAPPPTTVARARPAKADFLLVSMSHLLISNRSLRLKGIPS